MAFKANPGQRPPISTPIRIKSQKCYLVFGFICLAFFLTGVLYVRVIIDAKNHGEKTDGLEFQTLQKGPDDVIDFEHALKKSDLFISDFVPTEYTGYMTHEKSFSRIKKREADLKQQQEPEDSILNNEIHDLQTSSSEIVIVTKKKRRIQQQKSDTNLANNEISNHHFSDRNNTVVKPLVNVKAENHYIVINNFGHRNVTPITTTTTTTTTTKTTTTTTSTTTTTTASTTTSKAREIQTTTTSESSATTESKMAILRTKLEQMKSRPDVDPKVELLLKMLNETMSTPKGKELEILNLMMEMMEKLQKKADEQIPISSTTLSSNLTNSLLPPELPEQQAAASINTQHQDQVESNELDILENQLDKCSDLSLYKILPGDDQEMARRKHGALMKCYMDENADPCDKFYDYACGNWNQYHPIPRDKGGYDTFEILREDLDAKLISMLQENITKADNNATSAVKKLYSSCMNTNVIESRKEIPLLNLLKKLGGWPVLMGEEWIEEVFDWQDTIAKLRQYNNDILVFVWVGPDGKDSDDYIVQFDQSDLMLPSLEYYQLGFNHPIIQSYYNVLLNVATLLGADPQIAKKEMKELIEFEMNLASIMIPPYARRNYSEIYRKVDLGTLMAEVPEFDFSAYLKALLPRPLASDEQVVMYALPYFKRLTNLIAMTEKRTVSNYIIWRFIRHRINNLDKRFQVAQQELFRSLYGREETPPRWKFCVAYGNGNLGNSVGSLFVRKYFDEQSKADMETLTDLVQSKFHDLVTNGSWLSERTKKLAEEKIKAIIHNIGYPDFILDDAALQAEVEGLEYKQTEFFENVLKNLRWRTQHEMGKLDERVNRTLWTATPAVVNAYYSRNRNQIMFPAGILQPPFYHKHFPKSLNYGGIGVVIGHEITHGFDDKGRQFDHVGNINQWWDHESSEKFHNKAQCIIDQYNGYKVEEVGIYLNGLNTQGENIADNGGIKQSFYAYKKWLQLNDIAEEPSFPGLEHLTHEQLFFLNFAQVWCGNTRPEALRSKLKTAVHAPGKYRVIGTLSNSEEFARAYNCPVGSNMNPSDKCSIW